MVTFSGVGAASTVVLALAVTIPGPRNMGGSLLAALPNAPVVLLPNDFPERELKNAILSSSSASKCAQDGTEVADADCFVATSLA